jgi:hypothetical protein
MGQIELPEEGSALYLALNAALGDQKMLQARQRYAAAQGLLGSDSKRPTAWRSFGWAEHLQFHDYYRLWERGGLAHGAVNRTIAKCWQDDPEIIEGEPEEKKRPPTAWEKEFKTFAKSAKLWECLREADLRRVVGKYSGLILQIADGKTWNQPVRGRAARRLVKIIPAWEGQLFPSAWGTEEKDSETYGLPTMYSFRETAVGNDPSAASAGYSGRNLEIHPDRVIILGDIINGVPMLRAGYNDFVNIEKILGGSGESFLKNAARQLSVNFDKTTNLSDIAAAHNVPVKDLRTIFDNVTAGLNRGIDQTLITQGATVNPLVATVPDPQQHFNVSLQSAAASFMIPIMIWIGSQTGERSSQEDQKDWNKTNQGRRLFLLSSDIETVLAHLTRIGLIAPVAESSVVWSDLNEATQGEKLDNASKMADINQKSAATGEFPYSGQEIRDMSGHVNGEPVEALPEGDQNGNEPPTAPPPAAKK